MNSCGGGIGNDEIGGGTGSDTIFGGDGNDVLFGGSGPMDGADTIEGGGGDDTIFGSDADTVTGGYTGNGGDGNADQFDFTGSNLTDATLGVIEDFEIGIDELVVLQGATITTSANSNDVFVDLNGDGSNDVRIIGGVSGGFDSGDFIVV